MTDYISREAAIAETRKPRLTDAELRRRLAHIPAADVRPVVKAHFKLVDGYSITALGYDIKGMECSNCGATYIAQAFVKKFNFCPNCGADMREES